VNSDFMMKLQRRTFLQGAACAAALPAMAQAALLDYPTRPVHLISGYPAGGVVDIVARLIGSQLAERLGQNFIVENRPGAGSNLATELLVRATPDGYTLLLSSSSNAWNATLYDNLNFDFIRDTAPVATVTHSLNVMEVHPSVPAKTVPEFIAYAKANPGKINMASAGQGSSPHLYGELFKIMTGVDLITVQYRGGGPALPDMLSGQCQVMFDSIVSSIEHIRAGRLRPLAVTSAHRAAVLPEVPAVAEFVPGYEGTGWQAISAPKNTPAEIIDKINHAVNAALSTPDFKARLRDLGAEPFASTPDEFARFNADYTEKWAKVIRAANIRAE
jgi:tripartite-type tricarboxylate transporter receptor subunit TctC